MCVCVGVCVIIKVTLERKCTEFILLSFHFRVHFHSLLPLSPCLLRPPRQFALSPTHPLSLSDSTIVVVLLLPFMTPSTWNKHGKGPRKRILNRSHYDALTLTLTVVVVIAIKLPK